MVTPTKSKTAVVPVEEKLPTAALPDFMKGDAGKGVENLGQGDMEIPRLVLLQALSPQVTDGDYKAGQFYHTILEEVIGDENGLLIVPIFADIRYILWNPRHAGGGILARADDGIHWNPANKEFEVKLYKDRKDIGIWKTMNTVAESGLAEWGSYDPKDDDSQPAATKMWTFVVILPDYPHLGPMVLTFQRGSADVGKKFSGKLAMSEAPSFGQIFRMKSIEATNKGGDKFLTMSISREAFVSNADDYAKYKKSYEFFKANSYGIKDLEGADEGAPPAKSNNADDALDKEIAI